MTGLRPLHGSSLEGLQLWWSDLDTCEAPGPDSWLSTAEAEQAARFRFAHDAARYRTCRLLLRVLLGSHLACHPAAVPLATGRHGKPYVPGPHALHFNVSHSNRFALFGMTEGAPLGVDIEAAKPGFHDFESTARTCFTPAELVELRAYPVSERFAAFLRGWTRKEACLKAIGSGLSVDPTRIDTGLSLSRRDITVQFDCGPCHLTVESIEAHTGLAVACAKLHPDSIRHAM